MEAFDKASGVTPVAFGGDVAQMKRSIGSSRYCCRRPADLAGDELGAASGGFVVVTDPVHGKEAVGFAIDGHHLRGHSFRRSVRIRRAVRSGLVLGRRIRLPEDQAGGRMEQSCLGLVLSDGLQDGRRSEDVGLTGSKGILEAGGNVGLGGEVIDLVKESFADQGSQAGGVGDLEGVQGQLVGAKGEVRMGACGLGGSGGAVYDVAFAEEKLGEVRAVLA